MSEAVFPGSTLPVIVLEHLRAHEQQLQQQLSAFVSRA